MKKFMNNVLLSLSLFTVASAASASLITNGSFEQTTFDDNSLSTGLVFNTDLSTYTNKKHAWDVFESLPGWVTTVGTGIELQKNVVTKSQNGQHHVELDAHLSGFSNSVMTQSLDSLIVDANYLLTFYYKPRTNIVDDNGINVYWYDTASGFNINIDSSFVSSGTSSLLPDWSLQSVMLTAKSTSMNLSFGAVGIQNTLGGLIDNVSLVQTSFSGSNDVTAVPEPPVYALFLVGLGMFALRQRKKSNVK